MRRALDALYDAAAYVAAFFLVATLVWVVIGIAGRPLNIYVPGTDSYAGYAMAATGFLALAHTLKRGEHIRVELLLQRLKGRANRAFQILALAAATLLAGLLAWFSVRFAWQSKVFDAMSTGADAMPLWIPQLAMAIGTAILFIAMLDELVLEILGKRPKPKGGEEPLHSE